jgi:hypothetical protein
VVQIWPGLFVCKQVTVCPGHIWTTLYTNEIWKDSHTKACGATHCDKATAGMQFAAWQQLLSSVQVLGCIQARHCPLTWYGHQNLSYESFYVHTLCCRYSDWLRAGRFGDRISAEARISAPVQTGPGAHPVSYTMGTGPLSRGIKLPGRGVNHPPSSSPKVKERVELYLYSPSRPSWPHLKRALSF